MTALTSLTARTARAGKHRFTTSRRTLRRQVEAQARQLARQQAAASVVAVLACTSHNLAAARAGARLAEAERANSDTVRVPALRDVGAALGDGDYLDDTDAAWRADHAVAAVRTQEIPPELVAEMRAIGPVVAIEAAPGVAS